MGSLLDGFPFGNLTSREPLPSASLEIDRISPLRHGVGANGGKS